MNNLEPHKKMLISLALRQKLIKAILKYCYTSTKMTDTTKWTRTNGKNSWEPHGGGLAASYKGKMLKKKKKKIFYLDVHENFNHTGPKCETTKMPINR